MSGWGPYGFGDVPHHVSAQSDLWFRRCQHWEKLTTDGKQTTGHTISFCFLSLILYISVNNVSVMSEWVFLGWTSTKLGLMCLAQWHNTVMPARLETATPLSWDKHFTTEPLCSLLTINWPGSCFRWAKNRQSSSGCFSKSPHPWAGGVDILVIKCAL